MASFHVFIERPRDASAGASSRLAAAVADRYGIPAATLTERLAAGRLRVKTGVDRDTAETFAADLETLGAVCTIVDAETGEPIAKPAPPKPAAPKPNMSAFSSALAAARDDAPPQDLGALSSLSLATLDGADDAGGAAEQLSFAPPEDDAEALPASIGPAIASPAQSFAPPVDAFAPPEAEGELMLDVAPKKPAGTTAPERAKTPDPATMAAEPDVEVPRPVRSGGGLLADVRVRLAAGVLVAILVGFVPSFLVTSVRESDAFAEIDKDLSAKYADARTDLQVWHSLDDARAQALSRKREARHDIVLGSMLIWALVGGAAAFAWFRVINWDRLARR